MATLVHRVTRDVQLRSSDVFGDVFAFLVFSLPVWGVAWVLGVSGAVCGPGVFGTVAFGWWRYWRGTVVVVHSRGMDVFVRRKLVCVIARSEFDQVDVRFIDDWTALQAEHWVETEALPKWMVVVILTSGEAVPIPPLCCDSGREHAERVCQQLAMAIDVTNPDYLQRLSSGLRRSSG